MKVQRHLYDHLIYDSSNERDFAADLDTNRDVAVYVKLPDGFYISTPVGKYNPDWAIAFYEGTVKHIYFVAETKGTLDSMKLNHITPVEQAKIDCARAHFKALNNENVVYDVVSDYQTLLNAVMKYKPKEIIRCCCAAFPKTVRFYCELCRFSFCPKLYSKTAL